MKPVKVVSTLGKKQVSQIPSAERGELDTFVGIINAVKITPESVRPGERKQKSKRRTGGSKIYSDTPENDKLEEIEREKLLKKQKRILRNKAKEPSSSSEEGVTVSVHDNSDDDLSDEYEDLLEITDMPELKYVPNVPLFPPQYNSQETSDIDSKVSNLENLQKGQFVVNI
ncbi:hypothetical protein ILUMI_04483 [Ignelater luminosus]|uniref:Uncharacterized protein n=1 Tax=Ignelater luminosus TaxID=2038154 RepID=A0A8K0D9M1_IGNLU|nr:hypothetical protein ILUMI_04483 [Ignelater luminosus]